MTPIVFLPGMMCDARLFGPQIDALSVDYPVMCVPIHAHETVQELAREVLSVAPQQFALAGLSMGGIVAMEVMKQARDRVERVALMDTNPFAEIDAVKAVRGPQIEAAQNGGLRRVMRDEMKPKYLIDGSNTGAILDLCMAMALDMGPDAFVRQSKALMTRPDQQESLARYERPALVLMGQDDTLCPLDRHEAMARLLSRSDLEIIYGAGHLPTLEQPEKTTAAMRRWMEA